MNQLHQPAIVTRGLGKTYSTGGSLTQVLADINLAIPAGMTAIVGPSGSGKSTLLFCLAGLEQPTTGMVSVLGNHLGQSSASKLAVLYRDRIGFVFQSYNLVPYLTARENVDLPNILAGRRPARDRTTAVLEQLGLSPHVDQPASTLSGGQQQRVALARVLTSQPDLIFADEPTGALDTASSRVVMDALRALADTGRTVVLVTHDLQLAARADRAVVLRDGRVSALLARPTPDQLLTAVERAGVAA